MNEMSRRETKAVCEAAEQAEQAEAELKETHLTKGESDMIKGTYTPPRNQLPPPPPPARMSDPHPPPPDVAEAIARLRQLAAKAIQPPVFVTHDCQDADALEQFHAHIDSGLAKIDTGRTEDWDVLRFGEWPTTEYIAALYNAAPMLFAALEQAEAELAKIREEQEQNRMERDLNE
jgi:hypothetical protein